MPALLSRARVAAAALAIPAVAAAACAPEPPAPTTGPLVLSVPALSVTGTSTLTSHATLKADKRATLTQVVVAVRDSHGGNVDFPLLNNQIVSPTATTLTSSRSFAAGTYSYWVAYYRNGRWNDLSPKKTFTVTGASTSPSTPSTPSTPTTSSTDPTPTSTDPTPTGTATPPAGSNWKLAFNEDFDGTSLNTSRWATCYPRSGDMTCSNWGNGEAQWYKPGNVTVANGELRLTAKRESVVSPFSGKTFDYTSGLIQSKPGFNFTYGYMESRMWLPKGSGFWPAFWTWATNENWPPEIDMMEFYGDNPRLVYQTFHGTCGTSVRPSATDWTTGWHTFAADWEPGSIKYYVDGQLQMSTSCAPNQPMYLIANLALANGAGAPAPNSSTPLPSALRVDWIRVWQH